MEITKEELINYLVDVLGYSEDDARHEVSVYKLNELLTSEQLEECIKYIK